MVLQRHRIDALGVQRRDDGRGRHVAEQADLGAVRGGQRMLAAADQHVGATPSAAISRTECWVGLVFSSPAAAMYGTSVTWMLIDLPRPSSFLSWRIASMKGSDSISPTVPPISQR